MKKKILQYGICLDIGALMAFLVMQNEGLFSLDDGELIDIVAILCDAFFVPGIFLASVGSLVWISTTGFFDAVGYAFSVAGHILLPFIKGRHASYYDYKTEKAERRGKTPVYIFIVGAFYLVLSGIALIVWFNL